MNDTDPDRGKRPPSLTAAIRTARLDEAERSQVMSDLRGAEVARLELLRDAVEPVLAQVPADVDLFDAGVVPGERPRFFIDMIAFVEMGRDRRTYRFLQDSRHGRVLLAETEGLGTMTEAITRYIARRLVEREKALASLRDGEIAPPPGPAPAVPRGPPLEPEPPATPAPGRRRHSRFVLAAARAVRVGVDTVGLLAVGVLLWLGLRYWHAHGFDGSAFQAFTRLGGRDP